MKEFIKGLAKSVLKGVVDTIGTEIQNKIITGEQPISSNETQFSQMRRLLQDIQNNTIYLKKLPLLPNDSESRKRYEYNLWLLKDFADDVNNSIRDIETI